MEHFRIFEEGYVMPEPEPKWQYNVGAKVLFVDYVDEPVQLKVRFA